MSVENIENEIKEMGYVLATPRNIEPSYYRLTDGTILKIIVTISHLIPDPRKPDGLAVNTNNIVSSFVPRENRVTQESTPAPLVFTDNDILEDDVDFEVLRENFSNYDLSNQLVISVKPVLGQVKKTRYLTAEGEPIYTITINPIIKIKRQ